MACRQDSQQVPFVDHGTARPPALAGGYTRRRRFTDIPKSTLLAIARIGDEAEQLAAFDAAKSGVISVRVAKSIQKGETTAKEHGEPRPQDHVKKATNAIYAAIDRLGHGEGVPDKKALAALKEAKRLYKELTSRKGSAGEAQHLASE